MIARIRISVPLLAIAAALAPGPARSDGGVALGVTTLLQSGDPAVKVDLTFLGDGFTEDQQDLFNERVDEAIETLMATHPFYSLRSALNIHRVNVASPESGTDKFAMCGDESIQAEDELRETALDTGFCSGGGGTVNRCLFSSDLAEVFTFAAASPDDENIVVLVNDEQRGGCAGSGVGFFSLSGDFANVFVHELGHSLFALADEYEYDREGSYTGAEPGNVNVTTATTRAELVKWNDLILPSTPIPTDDNQDCAKESGTQPDFPVDLIGSYEGGIYRRCDIYRPQPDCAMRHSGFAFCSVCRRAIIRGLLDNLNADRSVFLSNLLVRKDHDPWPKGKGEIYIKYDLETGLETRSGRIPRSGNFMMDSGDSRDLNVTLGLLRTEGPGGSPDVLRLRVRESDLGDDDTVKEDHDHTFAGVGAFEIDEDEWRLQGEVADRPLVALFDAIGIKDDHEPGFAGDADVYVRYTVSNGQTAIKGRWPPSGNVGIAQDEGRSTGVFMAALPVPLEGENLSVRFRVRDADSGLTGSDDTIGDDTFEFTGAEQFGTQQITHQREGDDYRVTFSLFRAPEPVPGRGPDYVPEPDPDFSGAAGFCRLDDSGNLLVTVRNQGNQPGFVNTMTKVIFSLSAGPVEQMLATPPLVEGSSVDLSFPIRGLCFNPDCNFTIIVDDEGIIDESLEGNNTGFGACLG